MSGKIEKRRTFTGTGMMSSPEYLDELEARRARHARLIQGKPAKSFDDHLRDKMRKLSGEAEAEPAEEPAQEQGAIDPHLGLAPSQDASLAAKGKGRRSAQVIIKG
jgi:hypothetical protein